MADMTHEDIERIWNSFSHFLTDRNKSDAAVEFVNTLKNSNDNLRVFIRWSKGQDINAACGQLVTQNEKNNK